MQRPFKFTKLKLIVGYILILLLSTLAIVFIYRQTSSLTKKDGCEITTQQKVFITSNTLAQLYESESIGISFSQSGSAKKLEDYMKIMQSIQQNMDTLKLLSTNWEQVLRIDTINLLLGKRIQNLKDLVEIRYSIPENFYNKAIEKIDSLKDITSDVPNIREKIIAIPDSSYVITKKRASWYKIFSKPIKDTLIEVDTTYHHLIDTLDTQDKNADTVMNVIKKTWNEYQQQKQEISKEVYRREIVVIQSGQNITERIKRILRDLENEEISNTIVRMEHQQQMTRNITQTIAWIAIIACVLVILFISLIISDISQSQRYRKELERAKAYTEKLLHNREKLMLTVTHDIKSPLSSIIGYIELLNNTRLEERQHYFLRNMKSSSEHILHLANNMLDFSKLESKKMEMNVVTYNPRRLLQEIADSFMPLAAQKQLEFRSDISNVINGHYLGDPMKTRQIIVNILSNAIKYTREGKVLLSAFIAGNENDAFTVVIKDTGPGMTVDEQELIFKEFTRLNPQHNNGAEGTGLGLTITLQLIELLGGELTLTSKKGEGSVFTVKLPLAKADIQESPFSPLPSVPLKGIRAFIVDDDLLQLTVTSEFLQRAGITCVTCNDPRKALQELEKAKYQIVLSDIQMPEMDGFELVKQIRSSRDEQIRQLPIIALSARENMQEAAYQEAGFSAYLNKPFTPGQLCTCVSVLLGCDIKVSTTTQEASDPSALYNLEMVMVFADHDQQAANQIIESFIADCHHNFELMQTHLDTHEPERISKLAHKMLPMFKQLSVVQIIPLLLFLERMDIASTGESKLEEIIKDVLQKGDELIRLLRKEIL